MDLALGEVDIAAVHGHQRLWLAARKRRGLHGVLQLRVWEAVREVLWGRGAWALHARLAHHGHLHGVRAVAHGVALQIVRMLLAHGRHLAHLLVHRVQVLVLALRRLEGLRLELYGLTYERVFGVVGLQQSEAGKEVDGVMGTLGGSH
jgi:hypothetical protein